MDTKERIEYINSLLRCIKSNQVSPLLDEINSEIQSLTTRLISQENEQVRGAIKALNKIINLKDSLIQELKHLHEDIED